MRQERKVTRKEKEKGTIPKVTRPVNQNWAQSYGMNKIELTPSQKELRNKIIANDLIFVVGSSGSGKSMTVLYTYIQEYLRDPSKQLIVVRTPVEAGMDKVGALPNGLSEKIEPHFNSSKVLLQELLNKGKVESDLEHRIHFKIPNYMLGSTLDNSLILIEEAQQLSPLILKLVLERTGINSKVCIIGDNSQLYVEAKGRNALRDAIPRFFHTNGVPKFNNIAYHEFSVEDVVRSEITKIVIKAYNAAVAPQSGVI
jgi:phosphate starvation-inducible PhoH-like protein